MSNVAVRHVAVFGNMSIDFFILSTCRNKLNMFNFFRHVERRMPQVACCFDMLLVWTGLNRAMEVGSVYNVDVFSMAHTGVKNAAVWSSFASLVRNVLGLQISVFVYYTLVWYFRFVFMSCTWVFFLFVQCMCAAFMA